MNRKHSTESCMEIGPWKYDGETILLLVRTILKSWGRSVCWGRGGIKQNN